MNHSTLTTESILYEFLIAGHFDPEHLQWISSLKQYQLEDANTKFVVAIADQAALYGLINRFRDLGITLLSIQTINTNK
jgi:hypothetical protein